MSRAVETPRITTRACQVADEVQKRMAYGRRDLALCFRDSLENLTLSPLEAWGVIQEWMKSLGERRSHPVFPLQELCRLAALSIIGGQAWTIMGSRGLVPGDPPEEGLGERKEKGGHYAAF